MKKSKLLCVLLAIVLIIGLSGSGFAITIEEDDEATIGTDKDVPEEKIFSTATLDDDFADDRIMVVLTNDASLKLKTYKSSDFSEIQCASVNDLSTAAAARVEAKMNEKSVADLYELEPEAVVFSDFYEVNTDTYNQVLCLTLPTKSKQGVLDSIKVLMQRDDVKYAGPDYAMTIASTTPDDPYYVNSPGQWALTKIKMPQAWDIQTGSSSVRVGVLDTGIKASHPDLTSMVLTNKSRDFTSGTAAPVSVVTDVVGHGTQVASVIGAEGDNSTGMTGVAWNIGLVSYQVARLVGDETHAYASRVAAAINYATSVGIPILNMSIGWDSRNPCYDVPLDACISSYPGLVVCSAGNEGKNLETEINKYPAEITASNIIVVGGSTQNDTKVSNSNYGAVSVDLFAPGEGLRMATKDGGYTTTDITLTNTGTSFAAPHVAGVAALMLSECSVVSTSHMKSVIMGTVDYVSALSSYCVSGGRLNAYKALSNVHSYTHTYQNASYHISTCACGTTKTLAHYFIAMGNRQMCADCRYMT